MSATREERPAKLTEIVFNSICCPVQRRETNVLDRGAAAEGAGQHRSTEEDASFSSSLPST
jgi:hypothetical protein